MKRLILIFLLLVISCVACAQNEPSLSFSGTIEADEYDVFAQVSGKVLEMRKAEGDSVQVGEIIAVLDSADAQINAQIAVANVKVAQARLDELLAGTRPELVEQARAALVASQARLAELQAGTRPEQLLQAEARVQETRARWEDLQTGSREEQVAQARAQVAQAEAALENAERNVAYQQDNLTSLLLLEQIGEVSKQQREQAEIQVANTEAQLKTAQEQVEIASAQVKLLEQGATVKALEVVQAVYEQAEAQLLLLRSGSSSESILAAQAAVDQSQAALDYLIHGQSAEQVQQAMAAVESAQASLALAENQIEKYTIVSPVDGILLYKNADLGHLLAPGSHFCTVQTQNNYWMRVYLPQKLNGRIALNDRMQVKVSNLLQETLQGTVIFISPKAEFTPKNIETTEAKQENTVFAVKIRLDDHLDKLRPGMNAMALLAE